MKLGWRSYCPNCDYHIKKHEWIKMRLAEGHYKTVCPACDSCIEKYYTLDECGFGRTARIIYGDSVPKT